MAQSIAEKCRRHREVMQLALELRVTPKEAEAELARRAARARWEETNARLRALMDTPRRRFIIEKFNEAGTAAPWYQQGPMA